MLAYTDRIESENALAGVVDALATRFSKGPGLIATPSVVPMNLPLPHNYRLIALHELIFGQEKKLVINHIVAETRLGRAKKGTGSPGRPSAEKTVHQIWLVLHQQDSWPARRSAQVDLVLRQWPSDVGGRATGTIANYLRKFEHNAGTEHPAL